MITGIAAALRGNVKVSPKANDKIEGAIVQSLSFIVMNADPVYSVNAFSTIIMV